FPEVATDRDFIAPIWAGRKVGYLLDQLRLNGDSDEVKDEIIGVAREYNIATPYTSLLVVPPSSPTPGAPPPSPDTEADRAPEVPRQGNLTAGPRVGGGI